MYFSIVHVCDMYTRMYVGMSVCVGKFTSSYKKKKKKKLYPLHYSSLNQGYNPWDAH